VSVHWRGFAGANETVGRPIGELPAARAHAGRICLARPQIIIIDDRPTKSGPHTLLATHPMHWTGERALTELARKANTGAKSSRRATTCGSCAIQAPPKQLAPSYWKPLDWAEISSWLATL